ncbi:NAD(P)-dependent oxidoreductase [Microvirga terricola]|uniref:NAD(P)-dependent oxidoreductase n=1 Tax=Microvirga terricola TaxID=2719797 RepID=A0ABX0VAU8_9HYPH|nr:NAD(P)-dependent oxidoreductase [Microvirga terricola]NIX75526.1 NAD(P)-dependent oxidoreductase [Microvirga terricola]
MDVGFIGIGAMGEGMARRLLEARHRLVVYNRTRSKASVLVAEGAAVADKPGDACGGDVVVTMLADDRAVEDLFVGGDLLSAFRPDTVHISMSTISVALSERLTAMHDEAGRAFLAAPVFGRPDAAAAGKLFVMAAGPENLITRSQPLFDAMGQRTFVVGEKQPQANVVKLAGNFLIASVLESLGEAFALIRKSDVDVHRFLEILTETLFSAPIYKTYGTLIADEKYEPAGFKMSLGLKDIRLALAAAEAKTVPMPVASLVKDNLLAGIAQGEGDSDWSALARVIARNAGLA